MDLSDAFARQKAVHPAWFAVLTYPFGAVSGYLTVAIAYDLGINGVSVGAIGVLVAISLIPNTCKFLWAPAVDITWTPGLWYTVAALVSALGVLAMGLIPADASSLKSMSVVVFLASLAVTFTSMSAENLSAQIAPMAQKGRFGGWIQVGNFIGTGVGGGLALWLGQHLARHWLAGAVLGLTVALCPLALLRMPSRAPLRTAHRIRVRVWAVLGESWALVRSRPGALAILILFLPLGTGAASGLFSAIASDWHASADAVALSNGAWSGVVSGVGCLIGGYGCDRMERRWSYALFGLVQAACAAAMAFAPRTQQTYIIFTLLYAFSSGLTYASFSGLALEAAGLGATATKYNLLSSLSNVPIQYMTLVDGWAHARVGPAGMLYLEAGIAVIAVVIFWVVRRLTQRPTPWAAAAL